MRDILARALKLLNNGARDAAWQLLCEQYTLFPGDPALNQLMAHIALLRADCASALQHAQASLAARAGHPATLLLAARAAVSSGDYASALGFCSGLDQLRDPPPEASFIKVQALFGGKSADAGVAFARLVPVFPNAGEHWTTLGRWLASKDCLVEAEAAFRIVLGTTQSSWTYHALGLVQKKSGKPQDALESFKAAFRLLQTDAELNFSLGSQYNELGFHDAAAAVLQHAVQLAPAVARGWFLLGVAEADRKQYHAAIAVYRHALALDETLATAHVNLGIVLQESGDLASARRHYGRAVQLDPASFGRVAQALTMSPKGELWLDLAGLRADLLRAV